LEREAFRLSTKVQKHGITNASIRTKPSLLFVSPRRLRTCDQWLAQSHAARGHRVPRPPEQRDQGERVRLPAAPVLPGRRDQGGDARPGRHRPPRPPPQQRGPRRGAQRLRRPQKPLVRQDQRREQAGDCAPRRRSCSGATSEANKRRIGQGEHHSGSVELVVVRGDQGGDSCGGSLCAGQVYNRALCGD